MSDWKTKVMGAGLTRRCVFAVAAILVVTGCTTESSSSGCNVASGFTGTSKSELGEGHFDYREKGRASPAAMPDAVAKGGEFRLTFERATDDGTELSLRSASREKLAEVGDGDATTGFLFRAEAVGAVAVLAVSSKDPDQVVDLLHLRVVEPKKIAFTTEAWTFVDARVMEGLEKGNVTVSAGARATLAIQVRGEVDEANGALGIYSVGDEVVLGGITPTWETSDADVVEVEARSDGFVDAYAKSTGTADVTVNAGALSKVVHVTVTREGY